MVRPPLFIQGENAEDWRKANITPTFKKGKEENVGMQVGQPSFRP